MAYISKGRKEERFEKFPKGIYRARLVEILLKNHQTLGDYPSIMWKIIAPEQYKGRFYWDSFYLNHPDAERKEKEQTRYETFLKEVGGIEAGQEDDPDLLLDKVCDLDIYRGSYEGRQYNKTNAWLAATKTSAAKGSGVSMPQAPTTTAEDLDDEIPF
jgi:hypothetical protein